jgi:hypothetical protein
MAHGLRTPTANYGPVRRHGHAIGRQVHVPSGSICKGHPQHEGDGDSAARPIRVPESARFYLLISRIDLPKVRSSTVKEVQETADKALAR